MSTKSTISHGEDFHFYSDCFDDDHVYLEITQREYAPKKYWGDDPGTKTLKIPIAVWEVIREAFIPDFRLAYMTDDDLLALVQRRMRLHLQETQEG